MQEDLFNSDKSNESFSKPSSLGQADVAYKKAGTLLNKATGFMDGYDYTLNPYSGCSFGCTYCYAAFFTRSKEKMDNWGYWVDVKENAISLIKKKRKSTLFDKTIYMSSVTDPYQPIERKLELTRGILKALIDYQPRLVIQTRSQISTRDVDLFKQFENIQVNMTVTTDSEEIRKAFEPFCPKTQARLNAIKKINEASIPTCITLTPLLPIENGEKFAQDLLDTGIDKFVVQPFHPDKGKFVAGTREKALNLLEKYEWDLDRYTQIEAILKKRLPNIGIGKEGFEPI